MTIVDQLTKPISLPNDAKPTIHEANTFLQKNTYTTYDSWFNVGSVSWDNFFYTVDSKASIQIAQKFFPGRVYINNFYLNQEGVHYSREVFHSLDVFGDIGGIFEITMIIFGFFVFPISEHSFILRAARLMYFGRTKD